MRGLSSTWKLHVVVHVLVLVATQLIFSGGKASASDDILASGDTIAVGRYHACAILQQGQVECWGNNDFGQAVPPAGLPPATQITAGSLHTCIVSISTEVYCWGDNRSGQSTAPSGLVDIVSITGGHYHTCALNLEGEVFCWGENGNGQSSVPQHLQEVVDIDAGGWHTCALDNSGQVSCWGAFWGDPFAPLPEDVIDVTAGEKHTCVLDRSRMVSCWGDETDGKLDVPWNVGQYVSITAGENFTCAVTVSRHLSCWGAKTDWNDFSSSGMLGVQYVSAGYTQICAIDYSTIGDNIYCRGGVKTENDIPFRTLYFRGGINALTVKGLALKKPAAPAITGEVRLGSTLSVISGPWQEGVQLKYTWYRDGEVVSSDPSDESKYTLDFDDFGGSLTVEVTASKRDYKTVSQISSPINLESMSIPGAPCGVQKGVRLSKYENSSSKPKVEGLGRFGETLRAAPGIWPVGTRLCFFWLSGSKPVEVKQNLTYKLRSNDIESRVRFVVVGMAENRSELRLSDPKLIKKGKLPDPIEGWPEIKGKGFPDEELSLGKKMSWGLSGVQVWVGWFNGGDRPARLGPTYTVSGSEEWVFARVCAGKKYYETTCYNTGNRNIVHKKPESPKINLCYRARINLVSAKAQLIALKPRNYLGVWDGNSALAYYLNAGDIGAAARVSKLLQTISVNSQLSQRCG